MLVLFGALSRVLRSTVRAETDLAEPSTWDFVRNEITATLTREHLDLPAPGRSAPAWHHWRRFRDEHLATDDGLVNLGRLHIPRAVDLAHTIGLLQPHGPGSHTHPDVTRTIYGDGTIVRPIYAPPMAIRDVDADGNPVMHYPDPATGELLDKPPGRYDLDIAEHHGHTGPVLGHGYVAWHCRGSHQYSRVMLALDHIPRPGQEAEAAVRLLGDLHRYAKDGIQTVVYDGAFRGVHIDEIMRRYGYLAIARQPAYAANPLAAPLVTTPGGKRLPSIPLRTYGHVRTDGSTCMHTLAAVGGQVADIVLNEVGDPAARAFLTKTAVKRARRRDGTYRFNLGYRLTCGTEHLELWLSPHAEHEGDPRPEQLRALADGDTDTQRLRGLRSDAESVHSNYKRTLITDRAMALGWRRGLIDYYCFSWSSNALSEQAWRDRSRLADRPRLRVAGTGPE